MQTSTAVELPEPDSLLAAQIDYYRARAPEYDDWWLRTGRYEPDDEFGRRWEAGKASLEAALEAFGPAGDVLEIAAGTGNLTRQVCRSAERVTALDAAPEALAIAATKVDRAKVRLVEADIFDWHPEQRFDVVAFGFWLSHVPAARMAAFWQVVDEALRPGGRVFFTDNVVPVEAAARAFGRVPSDGESETPWSRTWLDQGVSVRTLGDGREFWIVKRAWLPGQLREELRVLGWAAEIAAVEGLFVHGYARRAFETVS